MRNLVVATLLLSACMASLAAQTAPAQPTAPDRATKAQRHVQFLTDLLSLNETQQQQAATLFANSATANQSLMKDLMAARTSLNDAVKSNNTTAINQASTIIGDLTAQLAASEGKTKAAFYQLLTPEQQTKLTEFESTRPKGGFGGPRGHRGHGAGPGGPEGQAPPPQ
jgi:Spy/CpxP family protein refolding chaperone